MRFIAFDAVGELADETELRKLMDIADELPPGEMPPLLRAQKARFRARLPGHDAEAELAAAEQLFAESDAPFYVAAVRLERAERLVAEGRGEEAAPIVERARETFELLSAKPWLARVDSLTASTQVPV
jgi:hypothetical protein